MSNNSVKHKRIIVGMSGGVDSSVAAVLLKKQGYEVIGVHMKYWSEKDEVSICDNGIVNNDPSKANACCSLDSLEDARRVCAKLNIPLYVVDFKEKFKEKIVDLFIEELNLGFTPNACVICNREIKFGLLLDYALSIGADGVATGHYAQIFLDPNSNRYGIKKAIDINKDQSYFLALLSQFQLEHILLPLGNLTKDQVRAIAVENELVNSKRRDSQDLCFIAKDFKTFAGKYTNPIAGAIRLKSNQQVIGQHLGLVFYTLGQRKGIETNLNIPLYVHSKDFETNDLIVDTVPAVSSNSITLHNFNYLSFATLDKSKTDIDFVGRYQGARNKILNIINDDISYLQINFEGTINSFASGQFGAIYKDDILLGAGKIIN